MLKNHKLFLKPLFAALILLLSLELGEALRLGLIVSAAAFFVTHFFVLLEPMFPKSLLRLSIFLLVAVIFEIANLLVSLSPLWVVSLALLVEWKDFEKNNLSLKPFSLFWRAGIFYGALLFTAAFRALGSFAEFLFFENPAGLLFLFFIFSWLVLILEHGLTSVFSVQKRGRR